MHRKPQNGINQNGFDHRSYIHARRVEFASQSGRLPLPWPRSSASVSPPSAGGSAPSSALALGVPEVAAGWTWREKKRKKTRGVGKTRKGHVMSGSSKPLDLKIKPNGSNPTWIKGGPRNKQMQAKRFLMGRCQGRNPLQQKREKKGTPHRMSGWEYARNLAKRICGKKGTMKETRYPPTTKRTPFKWIGPF